MREHGLSLFLVVWWSVGLLVIVASWRLPLPGWADLVFMALAAGLVLLDWIREAGRRVAIAACLLTLLVSGTVEYFGEKTGVPFGHYRYTEAMGPRLDTLPLAIPLAWWLIVGGGFLLLVRAGIQSGAGRLVATALLAVGFDLTLEASATRHFGYWVWLEPVGSWAAPRQNFFAWAGVAAFLTLLLNVFWQRRTSPGAKFPTAGLSRSFIGLQAALLTQVVANATQVEIGPMTVGLGLGLGLGYLEWRRRRSVP